MSSKLNILKITIIATIFIFIEQFLYLMFPLLMKNEVIMYLFLGYLVGRTYIAKDDEYNDLIIAGCIVSVIEYFTINVYPLLLTALVLTMIHVTFKYFRKNNVITCVGYVITILFIFFNLRIGYFIINYNIITNYQEMFLTNVVALTAINTTIIMLFLMTKIKKRK